MSFLLALAQAVAAAQPEAVAAPQQGVTSYGPEFFAAQQPSTALDMLNRVPGFTLDQGATVRGFEGAAGNVLIDGQRPASKTDTLQDILQRLPASKVARIDVIRGGAPGIDMQGKTVLANVVQKEGAGFRGMIAISDNRQNDGRDLGGLRVEGSGEVSQVKWEAAFRAARGLDDGMGAGKGTRIIAGQPPVFTGYDGEGDGLFYNGTGAVEAPLAGGTLRINGRLNTDDFKAEELTRFVADPTKTEHNLFRQDQDETEIGGRYTRKFGERIDLELVGLRQSRDRLRDNIFTDVSGMSRFTVDRDTVETIGRGVVKYRADDRLSFEAGGETARNTLKSATGLSLDGVDQPVPAADVRVAEDRSELFAKGTWRPSSVWTVDGGLRYETSTIRSSGDVVLEKTLRYLKPRLAVTWAPLETTQVRLRVEREVGQLNFNDFVAAGGLNSAGGVTAGNPDLNPEQAWVGEVAVEQRFWTSGSAILTFRHSELKDAVDRGPVVSGDDIFDRPENIGSGTRDVLALDLTIPFDRLGLKGAQLKGNVTKRWSRVTDPTTGEKREISGLHPLDWNANFSHDVPAWKITWGVDVGGGFRETYYRFNLIENFKLHTYVRPFLEYKPRPDLNVRFELPNLTRRNLRDTFYVYPGLRSAGGVPDIDDRNTNQTPGSYFFRIRKTFGG
jgi:outer membrane receptor protein involved in Fe transport